MEQNRISEEDVLRIIRRLIPSDRVVFPEGRGYPTTVYANERLFGVPVWDCSEGLKGMYLRHSYYDISPKERVWQIECGNVVIWGEVDGTLYPIFANGFPTHYLFSIPPDSYEAFYADDLRTMEVVEVKESRILNLDRVMQLKDSILIIDRHGILINPETASLPSNIVDLLAEKNNIIEAQARAIWEYQKRIIDYETNTEVLRAENIKNYELLSQYASKFSKLSIEMTNLQKELIRLRDELTVNMKTAESLEDVKNKLLNSLDLVNELVDTMQELAVTAKSTAEMVDATTSRLIEVTKKAGRVNYLEAIKQLEKKAKGKEEEGEEEKGAGEAKPPVAQTPATAGGAG